MADRGRVRDSEDSRWLVGLFLVQKREANSGPQFRIKSLKLCPRNLVFDAKPEKSRFFPKIKLVLACPKSQATVSQCKVDKNLMPGIA